MLCVVAAEREFAEKVRDNLKSMKKFSDWDFEICASAWDLESHIDTRPDVLLLGRNLPGENPHELLKHVPTMFSSTHLVLMVGRLDEKARLYVREAEKAGLTNIVTGELPDHPGDRPYTLVAAMTSNREGMPIIEGEIRNGEIEAASEITESKSGGFSGTIASKSEDVVVSEVNTGARIEQSDNSDYPVVSEREKPFFDQELIAEEEIESTFSPKIVFGNLGGVGKSTTSVTLASTGRKGLLIMPVANKGGVGKSTTSVTLAVALSEAGLKTTITDLNFGSPAVKGFFQLEPKMGIEMLSGRKKGLRPLVEHLLLDTRYTNLKVLPGPVDITVLPENIFNQGELAAVISVLQEIADVVIADTPTEFWDRPWLPEVFEMADLILAVVEQSKFSEEDSKVYAPFILSMNVAPEKIKLVLNKYSPKLHNAREIERKFNEGLRKRVPSKQLPRVIATIPMDWDAHGLKGYKGEVVGLDDPRSQWHKLAAGIAEMAGKDYKKPTVKEKPGFLNKLFKKKG